MSSSRASASGGPSPRLRGILFVVTTPGGPQFVFNYPQTERLPNSGSSAAGGAGAREKREMKGGHQHQQQQMVSRASALSSPRVRPSSAASDGGQSSMTLGARLSKLKQQLDSQQHQQQQQQQQQGEAGSNATSPAFDPVTKPYYFDSPDSSPTSSQYNSSASYSSDDDYGDRGAGYGSTANEESGGWSSGSDEDYYSHSDEDIDQLDLEASDRDLDSRGRGTSKLLSLSQTIALGAAEGYLHSSSSPRKSHHGNRSTSARRRRRERRIPSAPGSTAGSTASSASPRRRSRTPAGRSTNRKSNLSNSTIVGGASTAATTGDSGAAPSSSNAGTAGSGSSSQVPSPSHQRETPSAAAAAAITSPRLAALSGLDTSAIANSINIPEISAALRSPNVTPLLNSNTGASSGQRAGSVNLSRRNSLADTSAPASSGGSPHHGVSTHFHPHHHHHHHHAHHYHHHRQMASADLDRNDEDDESDDSGDDDSANNRYSQPGSSSQVAWERAFGFDAEFLATLCCPQRSMCDTKFEFTADELAFLGLPMHARPDGKWKKSARERMMHWRRKRGAGSTSAGSTGMKSMASDSDRMDGYFGYDDTLDGDDYDDDDYYEGGGDDEADSSINALERSFITTSLTLDSSSQAASETIDEEQEDVDGDSSDARLFLGGGEDDADRGRASDATSSEYINSVFHAFRLGGKKEDSGDAEADLSSVGPDQSSSSDFFSREQSNASSMNASPVLGATSSPAKPSPAQQQRKSVSEEGVMRMFHVVFVMDPPELEYHARLDEMYNYVAAPLAECLRLEQHRTNYVWQQAQTILRLRERAVENGMSQDELWTMTLTKSSLALALAQVYLAISAGSIANVVINGSTRSFQIPITMHSASLPSILEPVKTPGFYLTTEDYSDQFAAVNGAADRDLSRYAGLPFVEHAVLLLESVERIYNAMQIDERSQYGRFIKAISPTESYVLAKIAAATDISVNEIETYARHLIYWRRARTIIPIHRRGIYIVAPTAPLASLQTHRRIFARRFPTMPSLPKLLQEISAQEPRPFGNLIPSHAMRDVYLDALAWMLRYGYLAQVRTFIWLRISSKIKKEVAEDEQRRSNEEEDEDEEDIVWSKSKNKTGKESGDGTGSAGAGANASGESENDNEDTILGEPERATVLERRWMDKIVEGQSARTVELFWKVAKYMNGRVAFEDVPGHEGIERRDVRGLLAVVKEHIIIARHW